MVNDMIFFNSKDNFTFPNITLYLYYMGRLPTNITIEDIRIKARLRAKRFYKKHRDEIINKRKEKRNEKTNNK